MKVCAFELLTIKEQVDLIYRHGVYIGKEKDKTSFTIFFQLHSFYIRLTYLNYRKVILHISAFESPDMISPYLRQINIEEILMIVNEQKTLE